MTTVHEYGYIKEAKVFRKGFLEFADLEIGKVMETEEDALAYFEKRFDLVQQKLNALDTSISEATNKGSFLGQLLHLKKHFGEFDALGDFEKVYEKLDLLEEQLQGSITSNRVRNLEIKTALLAELKSIAISKEWKSASHLVKELQSKWTKTGAVTEDKKEEIEGAYNAIIQGFYDNRAAFYADLDKMMKDREVFYQDFLKKAETLREIPDLEKLRTEIRTLKEEWKGLGRIKQDLRDSHWESFQKIIQESLDIAKKAQKKVRKTDTGENLKQRKLFLERLTKISNELSTETYNLDKLKSEWRTLGPVSKKDMEAMRSEHGRLMMILSEAKFVHDLAQKKSKKGTSSEELNKLKLRLMRDLLERDKRELRTFNDNLGIFSMSSGLDKLVGNKLELQERKVEVKQFVLNQLRGKK